MSTPQPTRPDIREDLARVPQGFDPLAEATFSRRDAAFSIVLALVIVAVLGAAWEILHAEAEWWWTACVWLFVCCMVFPLLLGDMPRRDE